MNEATLGRARAGDGQAFAELTDPYRRELHLHCYRILGSLIDAEDMLQETLLAAWRGLDSFQGRASLRAWLYRIATNRCLNALRDAGRRVPPTPVPPFEPPEPTSFGEVTWLQPYPDTMLDQIADDAPGPQARQQARETVELAFVAGLQLLPPRQAATLILRDVLGFSAVEVARMLETTPIAIKGALQRARASLDRRFGGASDRDRTPSPGSPQEQGIARRFADAFSADDIDGVIALLTDDAWLAMPPAPHRYEGRAAIAAFLRASAGWRRGRDLRLEATRANTQPAFGCYVTDIDQPLAHPTGLVVLTLHDDRIRVITRFLDNDLPRRFGLPERLPSRPAQA